LAPPASAGLSVPAHLAPPGPNTVPADTEFTADGETDPVGASGDAADDMAFWVHPTDPALSLVIGTDKEGALETYDMAGRRVQSIDPGSKPGNVDLRRGFPLGGQVVDLIGVVGYGMRFYTIDPETRQLTNVTAPGIKPGIPVAGMCMYRSPLSNAFYVFADTLDGRGAQYELRDEGGKVTAVLVRGPWQIGGEAEGCVFDDERRGAEHRN
ncbi:MAG TPA: phytase, partial [Acidimicrobiia bacterium]|nr:phytase [Acidimicrobiia bacterium]